MTGDYRCDRHGEDGPYTTDDFQHFWLHMKECHGIDVFDKKIAARNDEWKEMSIYLDSRLDEDNKLIRKLKEEVAKLENDCLRYDRDYKGIIEAIENIPKTMDVENPDFEMCAKKDGLQLCDIAKEGDCQHCAKKKDCFKGEIIKIDVDYKKRTLKIIEARK